MVLLSQAVQEFLTLTPTTRGYSEQTIKTYSCWLLGLASWAGDAATLEALTEETLCSYQAHRITLSGGSLRPRTLNNMRAALLSFCGWLVKQKRLTRNPAFALERVPEDEPNRHVASDEDARAMFAACSRFRDTRRELLARAVLALLNYVGVRKSEMLGLNVEDVDLPNTRLHVIRGKGGKSRTLPLIPEAVRVLAAYLEQRPKDCKTSRLLVRDKVTPLRGKALQTLISDCLALADRRDTHLTPHSFRHSFASRIINAGGSPAGVQALLGHTKLSTTVNTYVHGNEAIKQAAAQLAALALPQPPTPPVPAARRRIGLRR